MAAFKAELELAHTDSVADIFNAMTEPERMLVFKAAGLSKEDFKNGYSQAELTTRTRLYAGIKRMQTIVLEFTSRGLLNKDYFRINQTQPLRAATHSELEQAEQTKAINAHRRRHELEEERQRMEQDDHQPIVKQDYKKAVNA